MVFAVSNHNFSSPAAFHQLLRYYSSGGYLVWRCSLVSPLETCLSAFTWVNAVCSFPNHHDNITQLSGNMEVIHEFSENRYYLNAISTCARIEVEYNIKPITQHELSQFRAKDTYEEVTKQPLGNLFLRFHLLETGNLNTFICLNEIEEYQTLPCTTYKDRRALRIIRKYLSPQSRMEVNCHPWTKKAVQLVFSERKGCLDLFHSVKTQLEASIKVVAFGSFISSQYYERFLAFRQYGQKRVHTTDFDFLRVLGEGGFGEVFAVSKKDTKAVYACKTMSKAKIAQRKREKLILNERNVLSVVNHPFIVNMKYAFQDGMALHLLMDLMPGGELQFHLNRCGKFSEHVVQFYAASLVSALRYLHCKDIVYRDMKPENILLDGDGYVRLTDLGLCSFIKPEQKLHRHCGTRSYMAPEQCVGPQGYSKEVDWWSLGVTLLHLLTGSNPFTRRAKKVEQKESGDKGKNRRMSLKERLLGSPQHRFDEDSSISQKRVDSRHRKEQRKKEQQRKYEELVDEYQAIIDDYVFPVGITENTRKLIRGFLEVDPAKRLGHNGSSEVEAHPFFASIDWEKLTNKHISPPFKPSSNNVNAEYVEATNAGLAKTAKNEKQLPLADMDGFDYFSTLTFQEEVLSGLHDKLKLVYGNEGKEKPNWLLTE